jgi:excisionase family DNA binding protein
LDVWRLQPRGGALPAIGAPRTIGQGPYSDLRSFAAQRIAVLTAATDTIRCVITPTHATPALLTVRETAGMLRVDKSTIYRWIETGELPRVRIAGTIRVPAAALDARKENTP